MLQITKKMLRFGGLLVVPVLALVGVAQAQESRDQAPVECEAKVQPEKISVQTEPVSLRAVYPESIGAVLSALIEESSGIKVVEITPATDAPSSTPAVLVQLDLSKAIAGDWTLSFQGESGKCTAKVTVQAAGN